MITTDRYITHIYKSFWSSRRKGDPETKIFEDHCSNSLFYFIHSSYVYLKLFYLFVCTYIVRLSQLEQRYSKDSLFTSGLPVLRSFWHIIGIRSSIMLLKNSYV